jgi:prepilin peptidase CpaA
MVMAAVLLDLQKGRIPNALIVTGLLLGGVYQLFEKGVAGVIFFLGGVLLPILLFGWLYYFRMIGAGDIKLLCVVGGFLGPSECFSCIRAAVFAGGVIALAIMFRHHSLVRRMSRFLGYARQYSRENKWSSYLAETEEEARFCFSVPVLFGILCCVGGMI